jgi:hypothetical protein
VPDRHGGAEGVIGDHRLEHGVVRAGGGGAFEQDDRHPRAGEPLDRAAGGRRVHPRRDDQRVKALVHQPGELRPVVLAAVRRAAQHHAHVQLPGGFLGALRDGGPVVVQRGHEHAQGVPGGRLVVGQGLGRGQGHSAVHAPHEPFGSELGDVAPDGHRGRAERLGEVGDAQHPVAVQRLQQLGPAGDLERAPLVRSGHRCSLVSDRL